MFTKKKNSKHFVFAPAINSTGIYIGIIKRNDDAQGMGRVAVWIPEIGGDPNNEQNWFIVSYASPFAGVTPPSSLVKDSTVMDGSQQSYGFWMTPPDLENQVLVCFVNGNTAMGFWFACVWQQNMNHMVPGLASNVTTETDTGANGSEATVPMPLPQAVTSQATPQSAPNIAPNGLRLTTLKTSKGLSYQVNADYAGNFSGFVGELEARGYNIHSIGGYNVRNIAGTSSPSYHSWGDAIDINPGQNPVSVSPTVITDFPPDINSLAHKHGLGWGGSWHGKKKDTMHFCIATSEGGSVPISKGSQGGVTGPAGATPSGSVTPGTPNPSGGNSSKYIKPVVEYNKRSDENPDSPRRPVFSPLANGLSVEGLFIDNQRGPTTASARREAMNDIAEPPKVFGYLTPRGNQVYVDDEPDNEFIRMRTRGGTQVLIHETSGYVYINSKEGNSWVEISDKSVDIYSKGSVNLRAQGSLNLHADGSLNIEADGNLNLRSGGNMTFQSAHNTNFAGNGNLVLEFGGTASAKSGGDILLEASGSVRQGAGGDITAASGGSNIRSSSNIYDNASPSAPAPGAPSAVVEKMKPLPEVTGVGPFYTQTTRDTITRRLPTHEPYVGHPTEASGTPGNGPEVMLADEFASAKDSTGNSTLVPGAAPNLTNFTDDDITWMTACIMTETNGINADLAAATAQIVMNRMAVNFRNGGVNSAWSGVKKIVLAGWQFSYFYIGSPRASAGGGSPNFAYAESKGIAYIKANQNSSNWAKSKAIAQQVMQGSYSGSTNFGLIKSNKNCVMYCNVDYMEKHNPGGKWTAWAKPSKQVTKIGNDPQAHTYFLQ